MTDTAGTVRRVRRIARLSQRDLARLLGVAPSTVARWETGADLTVRQLDAVLGVVDAGLELVDDLGELVPLSVQSEATDRGGRRYPAHLQIVERDFDQWLTAEERAATPPVRLIGRIAPNSDAHHLRVAWARAMAAGEFDPPGTEDALVAPSGLPTPETEEDEQWRRARQPLTRYEADSWVTERSRRYEENRKHRLQRLCKGLQDWPAGRLPGPEAFEISQC